MAEVCLQWWLTLLSKVEQACLAAEQMQFEWRALCGAVCVLSVPHHTNVPGDALGKYGHRTH